MGKAKFQIERRCEVCGNPFFAKTLESRYCSEKCGQVAYTRRKREAKKLKKLQELTEQIDDDRDYITVPEAVAMYSVSRTSLYQYIHDGRIPSINLGVRLIRVSRKELEKYFPSAILQYVVKQPLQLLRHVEDQPHGEGEHRDARGDPQAPLAGAERAYALDHAAPGEGEHEKRHRDSDRE